MSNSSKNQSSWIGIIIILAIGYFIFGDGCNSDHSNSVFNSQEKCTYCYGTGEKNCFSCNGLGRKELYQVQWNG